ncbi:hypothetical protein [Pseudomonas tohonis]|uniref:hypothetical protein n=1 Tax=Pseudomonas tohonis TaxID=2725477 RepID=UPI001F3B09BE|nr:hypothetical protein [Pseudomonas tohonis]
MVKDDPPKKRGTRVPRTPNQQQKRGTDVRKNTDGVVQAKDLAAKVLSQEGVTPRTVRARTFDELPAALQAISGETDKALESVQHQVEEYRKLVAEATAQIKSRIAAPEEFDQAMADQLARLENQFDKMSSDLTEVRVNIGKIETRIGTIESTMVTKGSLAIAAASVAVSGAILILGGGWWIVQTYLAPILAGK